MGLVISYKKVPGRKTEIINVKLTKGKKVTMVMIKSREDFNTYTAEQLRLFTAACKYFLKNNEATPVDLLKGIKDALKA